MNGTWSFYDPETGIFSGTTFSGPSHSLERNTPSGFAAKDGLHDHLLRRIDIKSGGVVDYRSPKIDEMDATARASRAQSVIDELERKQLSAVRAALLELLPDGETKARLVEIDGLVADQLDVLEAG